MTHTATMNETKMENKEEVKKSVEKSTGVNEEKVDVKKSNSSKSSGGKIKFSNRTMSSFGLSIGTGLSLESVFEPTHDRYDKDRVIPNKVKIEDYNILAVNVMTIARNIVEATVSGCSVPYEDIIKAMSSKGIKGLFQSASSDDKLDAFEATILEELGIIEGLLFGIEKTDVFFYLPDYSYISSIYNKGKRESITKTHLKNVMLYNVLKSMSLKDGIKIHTGHDYHKLGFKQSSKILMLTSYGFDLFNYGRIDLLESHTGVVCKKHSFNKRYKKLGDKPYNMLPYDEALYYLLGDTGTSMLCSPDGEKIRSIIYREATEGKWTDQTSILIVLRQLGRYKEISNALKNFTRLY